ncbi:MAG: hypothetical protein DCC52_06770 [Chloroflexi bacterium]|nr:MAG: hypothetical protein DCC52_06770 [Chloroflexota bacterium]
MHDTFDSNYRSLVGPITPNNTVKLRLRVAQGDLNSARVRVWDDRANTETYYAMSWDGGPLPTIGGTPTSRLARSRRFCIIFLN